MFWIFRLTEVYVLFLRSAGEFIKFRVFNGFIALLNHKKHKDHPWFQCSLAVLLTLRNICYKYSRVKCKWSRLALGQSKKCLYCIFTQRMRRSQMEQSIWELLLLMLQWSLSYQASLDPGTALFQPYSPQALRNFTQKRYEHTHRFLMKRMAKNKAHAQITPFHNHLSGSFLFTENSHNEHILLSWMHFPFLASCSCLYCFTLYGWDNTAT